MLSALTNDKLRLEDSSNTLNDQSLVLRVEAWSLTE